jgi:chromosome segregation ATPase
VLWSALQQVTGLCTRISLYAVWMKLAFHGMCILFACLQACLTTAEAANLVSQLRCSDLERALAALEAESKAERNALEGHVAASQRSAEELSGRCLALQRALEDAAAGLQLEQDRGAAVQEGLTGYAQAALDAVACHDGMVAALQASIGELEGALAGAQLALSGERATVAATVVALERARLEAAGLSQELVDTRTAAAAELAAAVAAGDAASAALHSQLVAAQVTGSWEVGSFW